MVLQGVEEKVGILVAKIQPLKARLLSKEALLNSANVTTFLTVEISLL